MSKQFTSSPFRMPAAILAGCFCHAGIAASSGETSCFYQQRSCSPLGMVGHMAALGAAVLEVS